MSVWPYPLWAEYEVTGLSADHASALVASLHLEMGHSGALISEGSSTVILSDDAHDALVALPEDSDGAIRWENGVGWQCWIAGDPYPVTPL